MGDVRKRGSKSAEEREQRVKYAAVESFQIYQRTTCRSVTHRRRVNFYNLPKAHCELLKAPPFNLLEKFDRVDEAIEHNGEIARMIVECAADVFDTGRDPGAWKGAATADDVDKARSTIRQLYRDWSAEGAAERAACYGPVLRDMELLFSAWQERNRTEVLVPGCGLGRLLLELVALGFDVVGNEISYHQMMASNWVLNGASTDDRFRQWDLFPSALSFSNQVSRALQLRSVKIPDINPFEYLNAASAGHRVHAFDRMGQESGDFCSEFRKREHAGRFNAVVTVYFIDTAPNLIRYVETVRNVLKDGGVWVNLGPLLWHFEDRSPGGSTGGGDDDGGVAASAKQKPAATNAANDMPLEGIAEQGSMELNAEEVILLLQHLGFDIEEHEIIEEPQGYIQDSRSMVQTGYKTLHFIARKR